MSDILSELAGNLIKEDPALANAVGAQLVAGNKLDACACLEFDEFRDLMRRRNRVDRRYGFPDLLARRYPERVSADHLMVRLGYPFHGEPIQAFVSFACAFISINREIHRYGWQVVRSGGTPKDVYWLEPLGGGTS